ncbi:MAG TPA: cysteine peptidase family C39 domain-containing protein, partial [Deltaproteobacteria bacterium]|nr:cysteine peptidase family C39 domain-containing protein [Deltaproteobacteria bacterium]
MDNSGVTALVVLAQYHHIAIDHNRLRHEYGNPGSSFTAEDLLRAAKAFGFRAKKVDSSIERLNNTILPAVGIDNQGRFFIIAKVAPDEKESLQEVLIQELSPPAVRSVSAEELLSIWSGSMILLSPRGRFGFGTHRPFNIKWFIPSLVKYRKLFGEVIMASLFLQLFALVTPLFFQVVMDKVLVHKGLSTLDVLAIGFFAVSFFE